MKAAGKRRSWSALLFLNKLHCANSVVSFGTSILPSLGVSGVDSIWWTFSTIFFLAIDALTFFATFFFAIRKFWKQKTKCSSIKQYKPNFHQIIKCWDPLTLEKRLSSPCRHTSNPQFTDPNEHTLSSYIQVTFHSLRQIAFLCIPCQSLQGYFIPINSCPALYSLPLSEVGSLSYEVCWLECCVFHG